MAVDDLVESWEREARQPFSGWDFSHLEGRYREEPPPWSYDALALSALRDASSTLDMGTGGGEKLLELTDSLPERTIATEGHRPNLAVARANLEPHGIDVAEYDSDTPSRMPFGDAEFSLVLNRHESFEATEVSRVLAPDGRFLTQQVGTDNLAELRDHFGTVPRFERATLPYYQQQLTDAGLHVELAQDWHGSAEFAEVGALVCFLSAVPWEAPDDFSVERYQKVLMALHDRAEPLRFTIHRFVLQVRRPPTTA